MHQFPKPTNMYQEDFDKLRGREDGERKNGIEFVGAKDADSHRAKVIARPAPLHPTNHREAHNSGDMVGNNHREKHNWGALVGALAPTILPMLLNQKNDE